MSVRSLLVLPLLALLVAVVGCADMQNVQDLHPGQSSTIPSFGGNQYARDHSFVPSGPMFSTPSS